VGIYESQGSLCLNFGQPYRLEPELMLTTHDSDESTSTRVMRAISACVPEHLWTNHLHPRDTEIVNPV
ncbi:MAG: hypothetical protein PHQ40_08050, partial [Anaerolineaceae bacterium]|nr:hypothetical protein [Anaerolineaceae bacterium]